MQCVVLFVLLSLLADPMFAETLNDKLFAAIQQRNANAEAITEALQSKFSSEVLLGLRVLGNIGGEASRAPLLAILKDKTCAYSGAAADMIALAKLTDVENDLIQASQQCGELGPFIVALGDRGGDETQLLILQYLMSVDVDCDTGPCEQTRQLAAQAANLLWRNRRAQLTTIDKNLVDALLLVSEKSGRSAYLAALALVAVRRETDLLSAYALERAYVLAQNRFARAMLVRVMAPKIRERGTQAFLFPLAFDSTHLSGPAQWQALQAYTAFMPIADAKQIVRDNIALLDFNSATHLLSPWRGRGQKLTPAIDDLQQMSNLLDERLPLYKALLDEIEQGDFQIASERAKFELLSVPENRAAPKFRVETDRQIFLLETRPQLAPYAAHYFLQLVNKGFFNQLRFRDVIPGAFAQTGVMSHDAVTVHGLQWPAELSYLDVKPGYVGFVSAGKRLNGSQLFISMGDNAHLTGKFTIFAKVPESVQLRFGEKISSIRPISESEMRKEKLWPGSIKIEVR